MLPCEPDIRIIQLDPDHLHSHSILLSPRTFWPSFLHQICPAQVTETVIPFATTVLGVRRRESRGDRQSVLASL